MQTEMTAFLITLIAIIFILKDKLIYKLISAFIISTLFWFKGVTLLNAIIILIVMLIDKHPKKEIVFVICWSWIFLLSEILLVNYIEPNEIKNMYLSTQYLNNFNITKKIADYFTTLSSYSLLWIGLLVYIINFIYHIRTKNIKLLVLESLTWIILLLGVYIQKLNYFYQIGLVISGILFSIFIFLYYMNMHREYQKKWDVILFFIMIFIILIVTTINIGYEIISTRKIYKNTIESIEQLKILEYEIPDLKEEEVLYIGNGLASYYIKANSYIDYTTTIYFNNYNEVYKNSQYIKDLKAKVKNYKGKYIVVDKIEFTTKFRISDDIAKLIEENYHYKQNTNISIYENPAKNNNEYIVIYEKNN